MEQETLDKARELLGDSLYRLFPPCSPGAELPECVLEANDSCFARMQMGPLTMQVYSNPVGIHLPRMRTTRNVRADGRLDDKSYFILVEK
jgi:hypothetical protein